MPFTPYSNYVAETVFYTDDRHGSTITAYRSSNGTSWTTVGSASLSLASSVQIGLAVSSHDNSRLAAASFDSVSR